LGFVFILIAHSYCLAEKNTKLNYWPTHVYTGNLGTQKYFPNFCAPD